MRTTQKYLRITKHPTNEFSNRENSATKKIQQQKNSTTKKKFSKKNWITKKIEKCNRKKSHKILRNPTLMRKRFICMLKVNKTVLDEDFIIIGINYSRSIVLEVPNWNIYSTINCYFKLLRLATQIPRERKKTILENQMQLNVHISKYHQNEMLKSNFKVWRIQIELKRIKYKSINQM